ncbi:Pkinase-domain-containing protein [Phlegmacium glaucopus]|nr:Pkinase-domain-containing protein [Phlegmacium glaucopus]
MSSSTFLDQYEPLDVIGNGSFGIIRKVRRKTDGVIFARKELNFERMSERDRKQIVSEVNILKDLHHEHIVRYHDRYVDREAGILYILMEYCGGGDLSTIIKQATKQSRPLPEDTIWNYFLQILLALHHCHHPNAHVGTASGSSANVTGAMDADVNSRRTQILHRDLKPDNVFLDANNTVKLGDFGLSKALAQASFANTYVGTPYYMSPELMQEKAYDSKSDIWSLGCLIYELCALKPPFHEAKTHAELSIFIRNGRIPPLPRGYSQALTSVIKSMLNLNPAMRPSAAQLLQHERLEFIFNVAETEKMLSVVKGHRSTLASKEREILSREQAIVEREQHVASLLSHKDQEIASLHQLVGQLQQSHQVSQQELEMSVKQAIIRREEELRVLICQREEEVALAMAQREEEIMEAVRNREEQLSNAWAMREAEIRKEVEESLKSVEERIQWVVNRENDLMMEETRLNEVREELEEKIRKIDEGVIKVRKEKNPLEEVKNRLEPMNRTMQETPTQHLRRKCASQPTPKLTSTTMIPSLETPISRPAYIDFMPSAMKGVVLTSTGETLATPSQAELVNLFKCSPKVGLNFAKIFDFEGGNLEGMPSRERQDDEEEANSPPPSPSSRKTRKEQKKEREEPSESLLSPSGSSGLSTTTTSQVGAGAPPPTRIRRPSIRTSTRPTHNRAGTLPTSTSEPLFPTTTSSSSVQPKPLPHPHLHRSKSISNLASNPAAVVRAATMPVGPIFQVHHHTAPEYDFNDEENLPSPFLKKNEKSSSHAKAVGAIGPMMNLVPASTSTSTSTSTTSSASRGKRRPSSGLLLRAVAAANNVGRRGTTSSTSTIVSPVLDNGDSQIEYAPSVNAGVTPDNQDGGGIPRPSLASARKASEEARKALLRA